MQVTLSDEKTKELLTEILSEMIKQKREFFYEIILEAMEDAALANAIARERKNDFVDENNILEISEG